MNFRNLHQQSDPLLICNVWDVSSAKAAEKMNFQAIGTSSAAVASMLGYEDGEEMSFSELEYIAKRILANTDLPLSVDLESGYSRDPSEIVSCIKRLADLGVVGINIEDSVVDGERKLSDAKEFAQTLAIVKEQLGLANTKIFLNVRTDTFLLGLPHAKEETQRRISLYEAAGADGIFTPCVAREKDIEEVVKATTLPVNVMCMPDLPAFDRLKALGVRRISMGNSLFDSLRKSHEQTLARVLEEKTFESVFGNLGHL